MNLHQEYKRLFPNKKIFNNEGQPTKTYLKWVEDTYGDPNLKRLRERELEDNKKLKKQYEEWNKTRIKQIKKHKDQRSKSYEQINQMSSKKRVEAFLHPKKEG